MYELIERLFGKRSGLTVQDLEGLVAGGVPGERTESGWLEYKAPRERTWDERGTREYVVSTVVAFLNKIDLEGGLLILGVDAQSGVPTELVPIRSVRLSKAMIASWLQEFVHRLPENAPRFAFEVIEVSATTETGFYIVEAHPADDRGVYFSGATQQGFTRRGDRSDTLPLPEIYSLLKEKTSPRVFLDFQARSLRSDTTGNDALTIVLINEGTEPATRVVSQIVLTMDTGVDAKATGRGFIERGVSVIGQSTTKRYQFTSAGAFEIPIYPSIPTEVGEVLVAGSLNWSVQVECRTQEMKGWSTQFDRLSRLGTRVRNTPGPRHSGRY